MPFYLFMVGGCCSLDSQLISIMQTQRCLNALLTLIHVRQLTVTYRAGRDETIINSYKSHTCGLQTELKELQMASAVWGVHVYKHTEVFRQLVVNLHFVLATFRVYIHFLGSPPLSLSDWSSHSPPPLPPLCVWVNAVDSLG